MIIIVAALMFSEHFVIDKILFTVILIEFDLICKFQRAVKADRCQLVYDVTSIQNVVNEEN